jgi:hypothetical protein
MKLFVLGRSRSGKTPFAQQLSSRLNVPIAGASAWVRERFGKRVDEFPSRDAFVQAITAFSLDALARDPDASLSYLREHNDLAKPMIVEAMRNPYDFVPSFDYREDLVVFLDKEGNELTPTAFEGGLAIIKSYLDYLRGLGLLHAEQVRDYPFRRYYRTDPEPQGARAPFASLDDCIDDAAGWAASHFADSKERVRASLVHSEIAPIPVRVKQEVLYNDDPSKAGVLVDGKVFAVSSYVGRAPTFQVRIDDDGAVFSYVPPSALWQRTKKADGPELELADLVYQNCPAHTFCLHRFEELCGAVLAYFKRRDLWLGGEYLFTMEWYLGNDLVHGIALDQGQLAFLPHHKLKFGKSEAGFRPYKKMRREWTV